MSLTPLVPASPADADVAADTASAAAATAAAAAAATAKAAGMRPIVLVGMMGAGKSTVGRRLGARLGLPFLDSDRVLEERMGVSIPTMFELEGEAGFREREAALLAELLEGRGHVLATGGGVILRADNRQQLRERAWVVYLRAGVNDLWTRTRRDSGRPLLRTANPRARIAELLEARAPLYEAVANLIVDTGRQPVEGLIDRILLQLDCGTGPGTAPGAATADPAAAFATPA